MMQAQPESASKPSTFWRAIPRVNLLPLEAGPGARARQALGVRPLLRVVMAVGIVVLGTLALANAMRDRDNTSALEDAIKALASAQVTLDLAVELEAEIEATRASAEVPKLDRKFLTAQPDELLAAIRSVFSTQVAGITVRHVGTTVSGNVTVNLSAVDHAAAFEWRRLFAASPDVASIARFDSTTEEETIVYEAEVVMATGGAR